MALYGQTIDPNIRLLMASGDGIPDPHSATLVLYDSTDVDVQESGLSYVTMHKLTKAMTTAGAKEMRNVLIGYDPLSAAVEIRRIRIYRKDGSVEVVGSDRVQDYAAPARAIYWGARERLVEVGRIEVGDAVETVIFRKGFTYALLADAEDDSRFIPPMRGHFYDIIEFWSSVPVLEKVYRVFIPKGKPLQYEVYNGELTSSIHFAPEFSHRVNVEVNPSRSQRATPEENLHPSHGLATTPGKTTYTWSKKYLVPFEGEPDMVSPSDVAPKLLVSTSPDWYAKSVWFHKVNEDFGSFEVTPEVRATVDMLLRGVTDELEKISVLNHWAAEQIRYSGISMGTGEGYTLHPGSMTFSDRCGVCKDKAGMLVTMLRAAGFESYPAMTMAGSRIDRIPADQFNHSVSVVKRKNGDWMLLDPTWIPGVREMWSSAEQQQQYLLGIPGGADIMTTPVSPADNHFWKLHGESTLSDDGTLEGTLTLEAEGQSDALIRRGFLRGYKSGWDEYIPKLFAAISPRAVISTTSMRDPCDLSGPMQITVIYKIPGYADVLKDKLSFIPLIARNPFSDYNNASELDMDTSEKTKSYGFRTRCSKLVEISETIHLPSRAGLQVLPIFNAIESDPATFRGGYTMNGSTLTLNATHRMEKRIYEASDWPEFRRALLERKKLMETPIIIAR